MPEKTPERAPDTAGTRASLLARIRNPDDATSWQQFNDIYRHFIFAVGLRSGLTREEAEDAAQETLTALARHIGQFQYDPKRCSFKSWLMLIARQRIIWQLRKRRPGDAKDFEPDATGTGTIERIPDPATLDSDASWDTEWDRGVYDAALNRVRHTVSERQFQIFDLLVCQEWSNAEVAKTLNISRAQVYLAKHRVTLALKREVNRLNRLSATKHAL